VDVKNNNDIKLASIYDIDIIDFIRNNLENQISFDSEHLCYLIPTFLPPLQLKPVLSRKYIEVWYKTWEVISAADKIIVLGYSCSLHDEHFNSIVKENRSAEIIVVDKNIDVVATNLCSILGLRSFSSASRINRSAVSPVKTGILLISNAITFHFK
jgi:hypothetical protein